MIVLNTSSMDDNFQQIAYGLCYNMAFAPIDLLAGIITAFSTCFGRFGALSIDHSGGRVFVTALSLAIHFAQCGVHLLPSAILAPFAAVIVHAVVVGIVLGQVLPLTTGADYVEDGINRLTHIEFYGTPWPLLFKGQQWLDNVPLFVSHVAGVKSLFVRQCSLCAV
jgi:hypothetical protein